MHKITHWNKGWVELSSNLDNPDTAPKTYCSLINTVLNNKKIAILPPVYFEGKLISDFEKKTELFHNHFTWKCSFVKNASTLPNLEYKTNEQFNYFLIDKNDNKKP